MNVGECLKRIFGDECECNFEDAANVHEEWSLIKEVYHSRILTAHPDKGGDANTFRIIRSAFVTLRDLYPEIGTFSGEVHAQTTNEAYDAFFEEANASEVPPWEFFAAAAETPVPTYRVEHAKSGRSTCKAKGKHKKCEDEAIAKGQLRCGSMDEIAGDYTRWRHLVCWRVPMKIWLGLPDPDTCQDLAKFAPALLQMDEVVLSGFKALPTEDQTIFVQYTMDKGNWARATKPKGEGPKAKAKVKKEAAAAAPNAKEPPQSSQSGAVVSNSKGHHGVAKTSNAVTKSKKQFEIPRPGKDGAIPNILKGKTIVMTGIFPEIGGGDGLSLGKARARAMIESFGGRVTSAVSGKTSALLVGKEPGYSKLTKARGFKAQLMDSHALVECIKGKPFETAPTPKIGQLSTGYRGNGLSLLANEEELNYAVEGDPCEMNGESKPPAEAPKAISSYFAITCDECNADCTERSYFAEKQGLDFCVACANGGPIKMSDLQEQAFGTPMSKTKSRPKVRKTTAAMKSRKKAKK
jgi:hypothetical protein